MPRYWISVPYVDDIFASDDEKGEIQKQLNLELESLAPLYLEDLGACFKVTDLEDAKRLAEKVLEICKEYLEKADWDPLISTGVSRQPECPECGWFGRFKDRYCREHGVELIPRRSWSLEEFVNLGEAESNPEGKKR